MTRMVVRPRVQVALLLVIFGVFFLLGVAMITDQETRSGWSGVAVAGMCVVLSAVGIWRTFRLGVVIDANGVRVRGLDSRGRFTPWSEVESIECAQVDERAGIPLYAPVIRLADVAIPIMALGTYSKNDAEGKTERLRRVRAEQPAQDKTLG